MQNVEQNSINDIARATVVMEEQKQNTLREAQLLQILINIGNQTRIKLAELELDTALARLAIIKEMKEATQPQGIPETTATPTEFMTTAKEMPSTPAEKKQEPKQPETIKTETKAPDVKTTAEEVPNQTATDSNIENPTPAPASEAVEAPAENNSQPTTVGSGQSQGK